jgi:omega-amidase
MQDLNLLIIQAHPVWHDKSANIHFFEQKINSISAPVDLIVLPEMFTTGFTMEAAQLAEKMEGPSVEWMQTIAQQKNALLLASLIIEENGDFFNRLVAAYPDGRLAWYDKRHLFRMSGEHLYYKAGSKKSIIEYKGWNIMPLVCYDLRFPVWSRNLFDASSGWAYDLAIYVANWPSVRAVHWNSLLRARAIENQSFVVGVNRIGMDGKGVHYGGDSQVINTLGEILLHLADRDSTESIHLKAESLQKHRQDFPVGLDMDRFRME